MSQSESHLQMTIVSMLRTLYPEFVINLSLNGISLAGLSPKQKAQLIAQAKREGMENGIQDFSLYVTNAQVLNFELKTDTGKQSEDQLDIQAKLTNLGHTYFVIRDYQSAFSIIAEHTTVDYRIKAFNSLPIHDDQQLLIEQFLHFPAGTELADVIAAIKPLYHI